MHKKMFAAVLAAATLFTLLCGCSVSKTELALVTDGSAVEDNVYNQAAWGGLVRYADQNGIEKKSYVPAAVSAEEYLASIDKAAADGARVVVLPGGQFTEAAFEAQAKYPSVNFILLDGELSPDRLEQVRQADAVQEKVYTASELTLGGSFDVTVGASIEEPESDAEPTAVSPIEKNMVVVEFAEQQAGFMAGYAAVYDGYTKLAFLGGEKTDAAQRYGYGFLQGADFAAKEMNLAEGAVTVQYAFTGSNTDDEQNAAQAAKLYSGGTEVIFVAAGEGNEALVMAADAAGTKVIASDVDYSQLSDSVLTSATKGYENAVYQTLKDYYDGQFPGGTLKVFGIEENSVALAMDNSHFRTFTQAMYDSMNAQLYGNTYNITANIADIDTPLEKLALEKINLIIMV